MPLAILLPQTTFNGVAKVRRHVRGAAVRTSSNSGSSKQRIARSTFYAHLSQVTLATTYDHNIIRSTRRCIKRIAVRFPRTSSPPIIARDMPRVPAVAPPIRTTLVDGIDLCCSRLRIMYAVIVA